MKRLALAASLALATTAAQAQVYTTIPTGGGYSVTVGNGYIANTIPTGNGYSTTFDNQGNIANTVPLGGGYYSTMTTGPTPLLPGLLPQVGR